MQVHLVKEEDRFAEVERQLGRPLTPDERRWILLAEILLQSAQKEYRSAVLNSMAA
jgi:hypothetical protein